MFRNKTDSENGGTHFRFNVYVGTTGTYRNVYGWYHWFVPCAVYSVFPFLSHTVFHEIAQFVGGSAIIICTVHSNVAIFKEFRELISITMKLC